MCVRRKYPGLREQILEKTVRSVQQSAARMTLIDNEQDRESCRTVLSVVQKGEEGRGCTIMRTARNRT